MRIKKLEKKRKWMGDERFWKWFDESRAHKRKRTLSILGVLKGLAGLVGLIKKP